MSSLYELHSHGALESPVLLLATESWTDAGLGAQAAIAQILETVPTDVLATFDSESGILRALRDGAAGFVLRSARRNELIKVVRLAADGHVVLSPDASRRWVSAATRLSGPRDERLAGVDRLSAREREVLVGIGSALSNAEIATRLGVAEPVVRGLVDQVVRKLGCTHRTEAGLLAYERGLCRPGS